MSFNNTSDEAPFRHENPERVQPELPFAKVKGWQYPPVSSPKNG